eukprot:721640-Rhodomonas_salina.2
MYLGCHQTPTRRRLHCPPPHTRHTRHTRRRPPLLALLHRPRPFAASAVLFRCLSADPPPPRAPSRRPLGLSSQRPARCPQSPVSTTPDVRQHIHTARVGSDRSGASYLCRQLLACDWVPCLVRALPSARFERGLGREVAARRKGGRWEKGKVGKSSSFRA